MIATRSPGFTPILCRYAANAVALRPSSAYVRFSPTLTYATRSLKRAMHSSKNSTTDAYCATSISRGTSGEYDAYQMPSVLGACGVCVECIDCGAEGGAVGSVMLASPESLIVVVFVMSVCVG